MSVTANALTATDTSIAKLRAVGSSGRVCRVARYAAARAAIAGADRSMAKPRGVSRRPVLWLRRLGTLNPREGAGCEKRDRFG
jgi:hypothetical protein